MATKREVLIASAEKSLQKGKVDSALKDYLKVLEEAPSDINILNKVGDLQVRLGKNEDSIPFFLRIAEHYARDGFYVRAIAMYKKINKLDPARLDIYEKLAELYVKQQLWMEAKSNYQVLADYLLKQDNLSGAIGIYQKMVAIEPQNLQLHVKLADLFTQGKRIPEALKEYAVVAAALSERGAHEEAIRVYEKALRLAPDNVDILRTLVPLLISINSVEQARAALRKGLEASPRSVPLFLLSAEAALAANDVAEARAFSDKARAVDPENEEVLSAAVRIQLKGRRPDLAFSAAVPLADAAVRRGEPRKAIALLVPIARAAPEADDVVKKIVDVAAGSGDEATALPYRSALAELYRKKGKLAEAADLLRLCLRVQPDNSEFRARLLQVEPAPPVVNIVPPRVPANSLERQLEVSISGFGPTPLRVPVPPPAPAPPPPAAPPAPPAPIPEAEEFEFDLGEVETVEEPAAVPVEPPPTPPRGFAPPRSEAVAAAADVDDASASWGTLTAAEALEAYEAKEAELAAGLRAPSDRPSGGFEALRPEEDFPAAPASLPGEFPALDLDLAPPPGFGPAPSFEVPPALPIEEAPAAGWPSASFPQAGSFPEDGFDEAVAIGPVSRPASGDTAIDDALTEADVFRRYGLLEKAVEQLQPWLEKTPGNVRIREKLFEIHLETGRRDEARSHALVLADTYAAEGREDRIRGLEALLGETLRVPPVEAGPAGPVEAPAAPLATATPEEEVLVAVEDGAEAPPEPARELAPPEETPTTTVASSITRPGSVPYRAEVIDALDFVTEAEALPSDEVAERPPTPDEPATEVIPPIVELVPAPAAAPVEEPGFEAALEPQPSVPAVEPAPVPDVAPEPPVPAPTVEPVPPAATERKAAPKARLSAEEILGLGKPAAAPPPKKARAARPDDLEALLGGAATKSKSKPRETPRAETVLPDDLLRVLQKPSVPAVRPAESAPPAPAAPPEATTVAPETAAPPAAIGLPVEEVVGPPVPEAAPVPVEDVVPVAPAQASEAELVELDFCLDQGMVVDAAERLQALEGRFPGDPELVSRRQRLEGGRGSVDGSRAALRDILSDDLDSVLDAELGRALTEDMVRESFPAAAPPPAQVAGAPTLDESGLFSDEQEFFNFADELHTELKRDGELAPAEEEGKEVSLEEIFRDFKKGVEQQLSPEDYETHYNLGIAYKEMGLTDEAIGEFQLAAKDPLHAVECCAMLGLCFLEKGLPQLAVKWYRKGLETIGIKDDDRLGLQYALAGVLEQIGDRDAAYRTYVDIFGASVSYRDVADRIRALKPFVVS